MSLADRNQTVVATFDSRDRAERAVNELRNEGFHTNEISVVARDDRREEDRPQVDTTATGRRTDRMTDQDLSGGTTTGAAVGAGAGLLASAGALAIPGIGPILAAGPLAATLSGAVTGGLAGGLVDFGIPEARGRELENEVRSGRALAFVETDREGSDRAREVLKRAGARRVEVHQR